jgi:hypothetical protein
MVVTSIACLATTLGLVVYLTITRKDVSDPALLPAHDLPKRAQAATMWNSELCEVR